VSPRCRNISLSVIESVIKQQSVNATDKQNAVIKKDICFDLFFIKAKIEKMQMKIIPEVRRFDKRKTMKEERIARLQN